MLLEFQAKNYRSFQNTLTFSMTPAPKQKGLDYSVLAEKIGSTTYKALSSAVIYGANASGKTNIIGAMDTLRSIILRGHINNAEPSNTPNAASCILEMIPFIGTKDAAPVEFGIKFTEDGMMIEYHLSMMIGRFLEQDYPREITYERLDVNGKEVFIRDSNLKLNLTSIRKLLNKGTSKNKDSIGEIAENSLSPDELFLTNGFKAIISKSLVATITDWFTNKFMIIYQANAVQLTRKYVNPKENTIYVEKTLNEAAEAFGISSNALGFKSSKSGEDAVLYSLFEQGNKGMAIPADVFESYGTIRFINEFPLVIRALLTGAVLVVDEFDASIHPMALMNIINIFHNDDINKKRSQLIFNTHNPIFLNSNLYRRDEIKFVERDDVTHASTHYALSDFKTAGASGVRNGEDYMKNYFVSQYGAIKDVDFSTILEALMSQEVTDNG
ncbi:MAG: ATP/GTP-binding protein [Faecousia sp.]